MKIALKYCAQGRYEPKAVSLATKILTQYKTKLESLELIPSDGGCFELSLDGDLSYSKLETGEFPEEDEMVKLIGKRL